MGRKKKRRGRPMKRGCRDFQGELEALRGLAKDHWVSVRCNTMRSGKGRSTYHVIFERGSAQILHYWPGNGTVWVPKTGWKGKARDCWQALDMAQEILARNELSEEQDSHMNAILGRYSS